jgi:hypothetical protein
MLLQIVLALGNSPFTQCVSLIAEHTRQDMDCALRAMWSEVSSPRECGRKALFYLLFGTHPSVLGLQRKDVCDATYCIRDVCSGLRLEIHALRDQIKDIRIQ